MIDMKDYIIKNLNKIIEYLSLFLMILLSVMAMVQHDSTDLVSVIPLMILLSSLYLRFSFKKENNKNEKNN
jgi:L-asparagine transporter-like permease